MLGVTSGDKIQPGQRRYGSFWFVPGNSGTVVSATRAHGRVAACPVRYSVSAPLGARAPPRRLSQSRRTPRRSLPPSADPRHPGREGGAAASAIPARSPRPAIGSGVSAAFVGFPAAAAGPPVPNAPDRDGDCDLRPVPSRVCSRRVSAGLAESPWLRKGRSSPDVFRE